MMHPIHAALALTVAAGGPLLPREDPETPREFGDVTWGRELEPALATSARSDRPILLLFQEVPG